MGSLAGRRAADIMPNSRWGRRRVAGGGKNFRRPLVASGWVRYIHGLAGDDGQRGVSWTGDGLCLSERAPSASPVDLAAGGTPQTGVAAWKCSLTIRLWSKWHLCDPAPRAATPAGLGIQERLVSKSLLRIGSDGVARERVGGRRDTGSGPRGTMLRFRERWIHVVKLLRAHGGCLGVRRL